MQSRIPLSRRWQAPLVALTIAAAGAAMHVPARPAAATPPPSSAQSPPASPASAPAPESATVDPARRDELLGTGWASSDDLAWTTAGDSTGLHLLVAEAGKGYTWRTAATLSEPGHETDRWIGNVCLTGSGKRAVVVYAPRQYTNSEALFQRGAFAAVVDLATGKVRKLDVRVSLAYHNPGCGAGEQTVLSQSGGQRLGATRLHRLDAATGEVIGRHEVPGQVTSAVPVGDEIVAAGGDGLVRIGQDGKVAVKAAVRGTPYHLRPDAHGGVSFLRAEDDRTAVAEHLLAGEARARTFARGGLSDLALARGAAGQAFLVGTPTQVMSPPASIGRVNASPRADVSTRGRMIVTHDGSGSAPVSLPGRGLPVRLRGTSTRTGAAVEFGIRPGGPSRATAGARPEGARAAGSPVDPVDDDRTCSIARNDPRRQVLQPHWRQVEWAANLAVQGALTLQRPTNWNQSGLSAWSPQQLFPPLALKGGGRIPAQIMLGILAQESNMWQASYHALEGVTGNPLVGDFYGNRSAPDGWTVLWGEADCGYGVAQITDRMRVGGGLSETSQRAIALDYATNIAAGVRILQEKWNQLHDHVKINNADPSRIENWFAAVWAYNTGVQPGSPSMGNPSGCVPGPACTDPDGNWGLGWSNNPINPDYPANRAPFLELDQDDARTPNLWPYPEKVMGWAAFPITKSDWRTGGYEPGYQQSWWTTDANRTAIKPPRSQFCNSGNLCDSTKAQPCLRADYHCWWHQPSTWKEDCSETCGYEAVTFKPGAAEPKFGQDGLFTEHYPPNCNPFSATNGIPANSLIIDDVPDSVPSVRPNCARTWTNKGTFSLTFAPDRYGAYRSKIDFHQIGGGMGGHFWFAHTQQADNPAHQVTGTWKLGQSLNGWARVMVHLPDQGAHTQQAIYTVHLGDGRTKTRAVLQRTQRHAWVSLGVFPFNGTPKVSLTNITADGEGVEDIAWDAIAFQPLPAKPKHMVVALGDSYASGEGAATDARRDYYAETDDNGGGVEGTYLDPTYTWKYGNACHRSKYAWPRLLRSYDSADLIGARHDRWDTNVDLQLHACSGAQTENVLAASDPRNDFLDRNQGLYRELSQLDKGYLDENTTLVTLSIGGNDARYSPVLTQCISLPDCADTTLAGDEIPLRQAQPHLIQQKVRPSIVKVLRAIHARAPNAEIALMGYPVLFEDSGSCVIGINPNTEGPWLNEVGDILTQEMRLAVTDAVEAVAAEPGDDTLTAHFVDPFADLQGHAVCAEPAAIHGIVMGRTEGEVPTDLLPLPSQQSFHPNRDGTPLFANAFNRVLGPLG
ncbi:transglycosylase SLT domain-containing protein [Nonomuraea sp. PA05]|uniref:golvesin C-terminal-like domain-containing protein n=1 Tax=Nonomuraea sp. PA05 TaxID=2604466 RepID=UPI0011D8C291|nr:GDSL-type esterase/lipase family protein [Nonomuraea sp. PA05]TYB62272.1 transglycosylase SLT domain-containing protein [Nonomuraea sp. PA05]